MQQRKAERKATEAMRDFEKNAWAATNRAETSAAHGVDGVRDLQLKLVSAAQENVNALFDYARYALQASSVQELVDVSTSHSRRQLEMLAHQAQQITSSAQTIAAKTARPLAGRL
jgi:hypothetical protein